jgi:hypothetical protein
MGFISNVSLAQTNPLPHHMTEALQQAKQNYIAYSQRTRDEILNRKNSNAEILILTSLDKDQVFEMVYGREGGLQYRRETVKNLAEVFSKEQLELMMLVTLQVAPLYTNSEQTAKRHIEYFVTAAQWKENKLTEKAATKKLSKAPFLR